MTTSDLESSLAEGELKDAGIQIQLSVGASKSKSTSQYSQNTISGSTLNAGGNIAVVATGANGQSGNINVSGSGITGNNVTLAAQNNLNLVAASNDAEQKSSNKASGWNADVHISIGQETGIGVQANGYMMDGKENGNTAEYVNTRVNAKDTLTLSSGNDTVLSGAQALGNRIVADVGNNLTLTSLQDIDNYQSKQTSVSGGFSFTFGTMTSSANLSVSKSKTKSEYASVGDQSGLFAGDAGYDVYVGNHTQLNGAVIASTAEAANNALSTGTLGWSAIENAASYKASSYSAGGGFSVTEQKDDQGNVKKDKNGNTLKDIDASPAMPFAMSSSGSASGTTHPAISSGTITVRNGNAQQQNVSELSRDTDNANGSIGKIFDKDKVASDMELAKGITELAGQFSSDLSRNKVQDAKAEAENRLMLTSDKYRQATPAERESMLADDVTYHEQIKTWGVGGTVPMAITAVTAAFSGMTAGNLGAAASGAVAPYIARQIKAATGDNVIANAMAHAVEGAVLAQMAGNSATAGAVGSAGGELIARSIVATLYPGVEAQNLTEEQKHIVSALSQISSGILGGLEGNSVAAIATAQVAGKNAVENNSLSDIAQAQSEGKTLEQKAGEYVEAENERYKKENCGGMSAEACSVKMYTERREALKEMASTGVDFVPVVGDIKSFAEAQSALDYLAAAIGIIPGAGDAAGKVIKAAETALKKGDVAEASRLINKASDEVSATLPMGSKRNPMNQPSNPSYQPVRNQPGTISNREYSGHALDRMQDRGITPSVVENTIKNGKSTSSRGGTTVHFDPESKVSVVTNESGRVVTVKYGDK